MRIICILALLVLAAGCALAQTIVNPLITVPTATSLPTIDGRLLDGEWSKAARTPILVTVQGGVVSQPTTVYLCHTGRSILMAFDCREDTMSKLKARVKDHDGPVFIEDCIELFIQPGKSFPYYHIALNTLGTTYDALNTGIMKSDKSWDPRLKVATSLGESGWTAEIEIRAADLGVEAVKPGDSWTMNICRGRQPVVESYAWSPVTRGETTFHDPSRFGAIVFGDESVPLVGLDEFTALPNGVIRQSGTVRNPSGRTVTVSLDTSLAGKTDRTHRPLTVRAGSSQEFDAAVDITSEGPMTAVFECMSAGKVIFRAVRPFSVPPMRSRVADLSTKVTATGSRVLKSKLDAVSREIAKIHKSSPEQVEKIVRSLDDLERSILGARLGSNDQPLAYAVWAADPWVQLKPADLPGDGPLPREATAFAYRGERAYLAANVANLANRPLDLRVIPGSFTGKPGEIPPDRIELRTCAFVPEEAGSSDLVGDALPLADGAGRLIIPERQVAQAFIIVRTDGLQAGEYTGSIRVIPTGGGAAHEVGVRITILPLDLPNEPKPWICTWGNLLTIPWTRPNQRRYFEDALDHGVNVFLMNPASVAPKLHSDGTFDPIDFSDLDRQFREHAGCLRAVGVYNISPQFTDWAKNAGIAYMSPAYQKAFIAWMREWIGHLKGIGLSYNDFAFELVDEPAPEEKLQMHIDTGKLLREADPQARVVTTTNFSEMDKLQRIEPYVDIWVPQGNVLEDAAAREFMKRTGKEMWMYVCDGDSKRLGPIDYYRVVPWQAFRYDLAGWGFFAHMWYGEDPWAATNQSGRYLATYSTIYPGATGPVTSRRWECYYKGLEDFRALSLLKSLVARAEKAGVDASEARRVLDEALNGSIGLQKMKKDNRSAAQESAFLSDIRRKVADASMKLLKVL